MTEINPYQSPLAESEAKQHSPGVGVWRKGSLLVVHRDAALPPVCIKTGYPADGSVPEKVRWREFFSSDDYTIDIPVSKDWWQLRGQLRWIRFGLIAAAVGLLLIMALAASYGIVAGGIFAIGIGISAVLVIIGLVLEALSSFVGVVRADRNYVQFSGVCDDALRHLPEWPGRWP